MRRKYSKNYQKNEHIYFERENQNRQIRRFCWEKIKMNIYFRSKIINVQMKRLESIES